MNNQTKYLLISGMAALMTGYLVWITLVYKTSLAILIAIVIGLVIGAMVYYVLKSQKTQ